MSDDFVKKLKEVYETGLRLRHTAVVDDDFPEMLHEFDSALRACSEVEPQMPLACDMDVYEEGTLVAAITGGNAQLIETFVSRVEEQSGQRVDWHYFGGKAKVSALGDTVKVRDALQDLRFNVEIL